MTLLHGYFHHRNQQAFQRLLDFHANKSQSTVPSSSGGKSWNRTTTLNSAMGLDVNARDWLGRTVLHLACSSPDGLEYVKLLLRHPSINVNLADTESLWTPLHRALYHANFAAALLLLRRPDVDKTLRDYEGYTAFDLYNSTLDGTKPSREVGAVGGELYTWGENRNAILALGDSDDRQYPEQVMVPSKDDEPHTASLDSRFSPLLVRQVEMSRLHTAVVTSEHSGNLRMCGFGSHGRLGFNQHTQYGLKSPSQLSYVIISVALGQDHTLALTSAGEILSWGLNRFAQLGYVIDAPGAGETFGRVEHPIQAIPRKIQGPLKREFVKGVAASKVSSACWTSTDVFTWGTNNGQLGYDKAAQPVQILPRKASKIVQPVISISLSDTSMACLLISNDVVCIWNDRLVKVSFPGHAFPPEIQPYRPPQAIQDARIAKVTSCEDTFAALSFNGELFTFSTPTSMDIESRTGKGRNFFQPQRVWALRKKFSSVRDVALGSDGTIIICTESGHVYVRVRTVKGGHSVSNKTFKFQRVPHIQRIARVCANSTGAFGALRTEFKPKPIILKGNTIAQDLSLVQPYLSWDTPGEGDESPLLDQNNLALEMSRILSDEEPEDTGIQGDILTLSRLIRVLLQERESHAEIERAVTIPIETPLPDGANVLVQTQSGAIFPAHQVILASRSRVLASILERGHADVMNGSIMVRSSSGKSRSRQVPRIIFSGCQPMTLLILLNFFYSDNLVTIWDRRVSTFMEAAVRQSKIQPSQVKAELHALAELLDLPTLSQSLSSPVKRIPIPSMVQCMTDIFYAVQPNSTPSSRRSPLAPDVVLQLADKDVFCHSVVLRARSPFFASFFGESDWTIKRRDQAGIVAVNMKHVDWHVMQYILQFMCCGKDKELFETLDFANSADDVLDFMFDVMAVANELLLDRLVLLCSDVILRFSNIHNATYVLSDATFLHAQSLMESIQSLIVVNMELFLEAGMLEDVPDDLIEQLSRYARSRQMDKSPVTRSNRLAFAALKSHALWLAQQDIPEPLAILHRGSLRKEVKLSPPTLQKKTSLRALDYTPPSSPSLPPQPPRRQDPMDDDVFVMDDVGEPISLDLARACPTSVLKPPIEPALPSTPWKVTSKPRVNMRTVMAEASRGHVAGRRAAEDSAAQTTQAQAATIGHTPETTRRPVRTDLPVSEIGSRRVSADLPVQGVGPSVDPSSASKAANLHKTQTPQTPTHPSGLGPVITPVRQSPSQTTSIHRASGKAWTTAHPMPSAVAASTTGMSFAAIQQQELERTQGPLKDKRSLLEIQEEEKALQEEAAFLLWWTAEEERIRLESELAVAGTSSRTSGQGYKGSRGKSGKGKETSGQGHNKERSGRISKRKAPQDPRETT